MEVNLQPIPVPDFIHVTLRTRQEGKIANAAKFALREFEPKVLSDLCDEFRRNVFAKAGQEDPSA